MEDKDTTGMYKRMVTIGNHRVHVDVYVNGPIGLEFARTLQREFDSVLDRIRIGQTSAEVVSE